MWEDEFVNAVRWWGLAFGLALCAPVFTFVPLFVRLALERPVSSGSQTGYSGQFASLSLFSEETIWSWLPLLGLVLGWASPVAVALAWRSHPGKVRVVLTVLFAVLFLPTLALSFGALG